MSHTAAPKSNSGSSSERLSGFLGLIERLGNRLPDQITIFIVVAALVLVVSAICAKLGLSVTHPVTGAPVKLFNLLSREGFQWILGSAVTNFTGFAPLGVVLVAMIGVGIAERSGLFHAALKALVMSVPAVALTPTLIFAGLLSHTAADAGFVILPPLAAMLYAAIGRNPLAGIAVAFGSVGAGFSANLMISTLDPLLSNLTQESARLFDPKYEVSPAANWYFMAASVPVLTLVGWFVANRIVEPRLGPWQAPLDTPQLAVRIEPPTPQERRGLRAAAIAAALCVAAVLVMVVPPNAMLRDAKNEITPFFKGLVPLLMIFFLVPGIAYGVVTRTVRSDRDAAAMMTQTLATMANYIVLAFFAGQFIAWFGQSNLGLIIAIEGAAFLKSIHLTGMGLMVTFVLFIVVVDLVMSSASAKWAMFGPVFVPMFMALGKSPEATQGFYRVGDSVANVITPLNFYFPILIAVAQRYVPNAGLGTLIAAMLPFSIAFLIVWLGMLVIWVLAGIPLGPGAPLTYALPS